MKLGEWTTSSYSNGSGGNNCVEVEKAEDDSVRVRNSRFPAICNLRFTSAEWNAFIAGVKAGEFDL